MATRWRWPPDNSFGLCIMRDFKADVGEGLLGARDALGGGGAVIDEGQLHVVQRRGAGEEIEGLEDEADFLVADAGELVVVEIADELVVEPVLAFGGRIKAADEVHQRGLARSGWAHDGDILIAANAQRDAAQGLDLLLRAHVVGAPKVFDDDDVVGVDDRRLRKFFDADAVQSHLKFNLIRNSRAAWRHIKTDQLELLCGDYRHGFVALDQRALLEIAQSFIGPLTISSPLFTPESTSMSVAPVMPVVTGTKLARSLPCASFLTRKTPCIGLDFGLVTMTPERRRAWHCQWPDRAW